MRGIKASSPSEENRIVFGLFRDAWTDGNWLTVAIFLSYLAGFILVDTFPILMKFFMPRGLYDYLLEAQDKSAGSASLGKSGVRHDNAKATGFRHTDLGFEITEMHANFDPKKSYTVWRVIQQILETQLDQYIRENWRGRQDGRGGDPAQTGDYGFASYSISIGSPPQD
jgi:hypothetical protein